FPDPFTLAEVLTLGADLYVDKAQGPGRLLEHLRTLVVDGTVPPDEADEDRLAAIRAELDGLHERARGRRLISAERRRYAHLRLIEGRLLRRHSNDPEAAAPDRAS